MGHTEKAATEELENQANPMSYKSEEGGVQKSVWLYIIQTIRKRKFNFKLI